MNTKLLRQKVLDLAIHGKLVPQNPEHESASELLKRIRGESLPLSPDGKPSSATPSPRGKAPKTPSTPISEDEIPFEIPENWCWCRLGDICSFIGGGTPDKSKKEFWNGSINWASVKDIKGNELYSTEDYITELGVECSSAHIAEVDDIILITRISPGKAILSKIRTAINQDLKIVLPLIPIEKKFLLYYFQFSESDFIENSSGTTVKGIKLEYLVQKSIPLPPLEEQKLIVEEIERIFALIDTVEQNKTDLETVIKQTKSKILDLAIHGKLVPQDRADEPASKLLEKLRAEKEEKIAKGELKRDKNDSYIYRADDGKWVERKADGSEEEIEVPFEIPEGWCWCNFAEIAEVINGKNQSKVVNENGQYPIYGSGGIMGYADDFICPENTTIIGRKGSINNPIYVTEKFWNVDTAFGLHSNEEVVISKYLFYFCKSFDFTKLDNSTTLPSLTKTNIQKIFFPLPPIEKQRQMVIKIEIIFKSLDMIINII